MRIIKKISRKIQKKFICLYDGVNNKKFTKNYVKFLKKCGVHISGAPEYICSSAYLDGTGLHRIYIGDKTIISKEALLLTHDFAPRTGLLTLGYDFKTCENYHVEQDIRIGNNVFVGARAIILPGTVIEDNVVIGAGAVVRGKICGDSVVVGNPAKKICSLSEWARKHELDDFIKEKIF